MGSPRSNRILMMSLLLSTACNDEAGTNPEKDAGVSAIITDSGARLDSGLSGNGCEDKDLDGFCVEQDCNDKNAYIFPDAPEACNAIDDNCDDNVDEGLGSHQCGQGPCLREVPNCVDGRPKACIPGTPKAESCNGLDDDCNGIVDDDLEAPPMTCGAGGCRRTSVCMNGAWQMCVPGEPETETCNDIDDNCDGITDEGFRAEYVYGTYTVLRMYQSGCDGSAQRIGLTCSSAMHRYCATKKCANSGFGPLENSQDISHVACLQSDVVATTFTELETHHNGCTGITQRFGPECNAAIHRFCVNRGEVSGFGPVENQENNASVGCVSADVATLIQTTYTQLAMHHAPCNGTTERFGPNCFAAISRFCRSQGHTTGYGPLENLGDTALVFCIDP